ncbi:helix-turn-helix domain-containing protein [Prosthecomicrobium sp. N25]|uniref:helix-turn-helix domain-containing protein n=1 Tax=Prosthecomicrobium sp. N25 TaxID=3129254 RepID=UPI003077729C
MSDQSLRVHTAEFKVAALRRLEAGETLASVAADLGVARQLLYKWRNAFRAKGLAGLSAKRGRKPKPRAAAPAPAGDPPAAGSPQDRASAGPPQDPAAAATAELAEARRRIAELEAKIGRQQMELDFFRRALQPTDAASPQRPVPPGSTRSSRT